MKRFREIRSLGGISIDIGVLCSLSVIGIARVGWIKRLPSGSMGFAGKILSASQPESAGAAGSEAVTRRMSISSGGNRTVEFLLCNGSGCPEGIQSHFNASQLQPKSTVRVIARKVDGEFVAREIFSPAAKTIYGTVVRPEGGTNAKVTAVYARFSEILESGLIRQVRIRYCGGERCSKKTQNIEALAVPGASLLLSGRFNVLNEFETEKIEIVSQQTTPAAAIRPSSSASSYSSSSRSSSSSSAKPPPTAVPTPTTPPKKCPRTGDPSTCTQFCQDPEGEFEYQCCDPATEDCVVDPTVDSGAPHCVIRNCGPGEFKCVSAGNTTWFECCDAGQRCTTSANGTAGCLSCPAGTEVCRNQDTSPRDDICCPVGRCGHHTEGDPYCLPSSSSSSSSSSRSSSSRTSSSPSSSPAR